MSLRNSPYPEDGCEEFEPKPKQDRQEKKTIFIGLIGVIAMIFSIVISYEYAVIKSDYVPLIVFISTCIYSEFKETYKIRRDKEECK